MNIFLIGNFDGVHKGHQYIIDKAKNLYNIDSNSINVITFTPHPVVYFNENAKVLLVSYKEKKHLLKKYGVTGVFEMAFSSIRDLSCEDFVNLIVANHKIDIVVTGNDFKFGKDAQGGVTLLKSLLEKNFIEHYTVEAFMLGNMKYSSTYIRELLAEGRVEEANKILGHNFKLTSKVIKGKQLARKLGFPTINMSLHKNLTKIKYGVYASKTIIDGKEYISISNFGVRPTVNTSSQELLETHILDYEGDLYNRILSVDLLHFIRDEKRFLDLDELKKYIKQDVEIVRKLDLSS